MVTLPEKSNPWSKNAVIPKVIEVRYEHDYVVHLRFADGTEGDVDLHEELYGEMFEPLVNLEEFAKVTVHSEFHTLCWPNGADIAPEFLYEKVTGIRL